MSTIDLVSLERATDLVRVNKDRLQLDAWCAIIDIKRTSSEIIMICASYCERWQAVILELYPQAPEVAKQLQTKGREPTFVASCNHYVLGPYLQQPRINIIIPTSSPDADNVWVLVLHEHGHNWLQLAVKDPLQLAS